jgi:5-oxopent-3-ene-1,2,5-tricarboxylate decarboxylase / 2-hydroxyhepta-2,4-diene-1,7-dioate isomerase
MIAGIAYGVALNDRAALDDLAPQFAQKPYNAPPVAPIIYIKPRNCFVASECTVSIPADVERLSIAPTIAILFGRDVASGGPEAATGAIAAACLALDVSLPISSYYRPAIRQQCRDGFLPLGDWGNWSADLECAEMTLSIDGHAAHRWSLARLARPVATLIAQLSQFMTLRAGDLLLVGLPGDAPSVQAGQSAELSMAGLASLHARFAAEARP